MKKPATINLPAVKCYHCGEPCENENFLLEEKQFCCHGCKLVYEVLAENDLCNYYNIEAFPGESQKSQTGKSNRFDYLNDEETARNLLDFQNQEQSHVTFFIPLIHCASCIWLLENLFHIHSGIISSRVDFIKKKVQIKFSNQKLSLKELVELLSAIGYEPRINLANLEKKQKNYSDNRIVKKLAVAGFCFGNMMLFSVPEYFSETVLIAENFRGLFNYLNVVLALPVVLYSANDYYISAWNSLRLKRINMDVPIVLGIIALFFYSLWEILIAGNAGYMDSLGGLLFFLLLGKIYQQKTFATLEFDRDYKSYFPIAITRLSQDVEEVIPLRKLEVGNLIRVRNEELIPADSILLSESANIDYSFVTGEEVPVPKKKDDLIFAGGRQLGDPILLTVQKSPSQGYLTDLWNNEAFEKKKDKLLEPLSNKISASFTWIVIFISVSALLFWSFTDFSIAVKSFVSVLIVACPCALAMSTPFTLGNTLRIFGRGKFYLKNASVVERLALIDTVVFDKTGTLTSPSQAKINFHGELLSNETKSLIKSLVSKSAHPLSIRINQWLGNISVLEIENFEEIKGNGLRAIYKNQEIKIGSSDFTGSKNGELEEFGNLVFFQVEGVTIGYFHIQSGLREGLEDVVKALRGKYEIHVLSGDHPHELGSLKAKLGKDIQYNFLQSPKDKMNYLRDLNTSGKETLMIGDGLNDAGALQESNVGIAVTDQVSHFSPASDAILSSDSLRSISDYLGFAKQSRNIIKASFGLSLLYNVVGVSLAVQGLLSPVICAVLMPVSSISVVLFTTLSTNILAWKKGLIIQKST
ncbi:MAG TPA: ATPase [Algoriphagus sp.]|uniref:heavy metal translocating P-type ATPase n=2 Tax=Algoriphagus TaxID=246875 RepID=UPI000C44813D|nr:MULTISPECIES: heavy metal translocating P-type ATPase metal-binding domain-containing protein [unclassified Algoriphagus]MAL15127.1 ATPase [Algoriphagus sp.]QYH37756.1 HAD-IC family P-type ATPase [Algoriphagus sp. NBT04N3]HAH35382.1 ATPase [Algoriphagus sp.]HCD88603.1 ATPase [Algoriphagus sp.]HCH44527.1 ATPase [Algoriphagus sp.]